MRERVLIGIQVKIIEIIKCDLVKYAEEVVNTKLSKQECIPVGCILTAMYSGCQGSLHPDVPDRDPWTETPRQRPPDRDPMLDRDPLLDRDSLVGRPLIGRSRQTSLPPDRDPLLDRDSLVGRPLIGRSRQTPLPPDRDLPDRDSPWTETHGQRTPTGERPPCWTETPP